jgi:hypothetical protein
MGEASGKNRFASPFLFSVQSSDMHYWRKDNFDGLARIAGAFQSETDFSLFVKYLRLREKGLRKQALACLNQFVQLASGWDFEHRRDIVNRLMSLRHEWPSVMDLIPFPHYDGLVNPTLDEWTEREPQNPVPFRWRGRDDKDLRHAIRLDPHEEIARINLANRLLARVDYAIHELPNGFGYIGQPAGDMQTLDEVDQLAADLPAELARPLAHESAALREVVEAYLEFEANSAPVSFREWMWERNRPLLHRWSYVPYDLG